jgi:hypothetical protein
MQPHLLVGSAPSLSTALLIAGVFLSAGLASSEEKSNETVSISQVNAQFIAKDNENTFRLFEFNSKRKPRLSSKDTQIKCRLNSGQPWIPLPMEIPFPVTHKAPFEHKISCRGRDRKAFFVRVLFDLADGFDDLQIRGKSSLNQAILATPGGQLIKISPTGEMIFFRRSPTGNFNDFKPHNVRGKIFYSYLNNTITTPGVTSEGTRTILDENFSNIEATDFLTDIHEFDYLGPNHYLYSSYEMVDLPDGTCFLNQRAVERKNNKEVRSFSVRDFVEAGFRIQEESITVFHGRSCKTMSHLNAIQIISENSWLMSLGEGVVLMFNHVTRKPEWILGGFQDQFDIIKKVKMNYIHTPRWQLSENRLIIYDNNYQTKRSRILDFKLDIANRKVIHLKEIPLGNIYSVHSGGVEANFPLSPVSDLIYSVGTGMPEKDDWNFIEHNGTNQTLAIRFGKSKMSTYSYRTYRSTL